MKETKSSKYLLIMPKKRLQSNLRVKNSTAFIAEYGSGLPIIGVLGEFDALPGLLKKAQTTKRL
jgi:metal-dependent amidase/aminoacylase/carboxypeptidase family protein